MDGKLFQVLGPATAKDRWALTKSSGNARHVVVTLVCRAEICTTS